METPHAHTIGQAWIDGLLERKDKAKRAADYAANSALGTQKFVSEFHGLIGYIESIEDKRSKKPTPKPERLFDAS